MTRRLGTRFWTETALAALSGLLLVLTLLWRDWIEATTGYDPDQHNGSAEWTIVAALLATTLLFSLLARTEWKKRLAEQPASPNASAS